MSALISWVLLLGGIAATIVAASLATVVEPGAQLVIAFGGLLAVVLGAVGLMLSRVAGDAPRELRPPGASDRARRPGRRAPPGPTGLTGLTGPPSALRSRSPRMPVVIAAFVAGVAWALTSTPTSSGPLDIAAAVLLIATPIAVVVAVASRILRGRASGPALTVALAGASLFIGAVVVGWFESMLA